jgi:hypothetical protein
VLRTGGIKAISNKGLSMRRFLLLILTFLSLAQYARAQTRQEKWEGFRTVDEIRDLNLPFMEFAENAVFFMRTVGLMKNPNEKVEILDMKTDPRVQKKITDLMLLTNDNFYFQVETCRKQHLRYCPIFDKANDATMFFNSGNFYTCRHTFHNWISLAAEANGLNVDAISPPIILRKLNPQKPGHFIVIYQSAFEKDPLLKFSMINNDRRLNYKYSRSNTPTALVQFVDYTDFTEMTISNVNHFGNHSLPIRSDSWNTIKTNEEIFLVGYPSRTNDFNGTPGDSPGNTLLVSTGFILNPLPNEIALLNSAYSSGGSSGSPVFSKSGELLGMHCGSFKGAKPSDSSAYFIPLDKNAISEFWNQLDYSILDATKQAQVDTTN